MTLVSLKGGAGFNAPVDENIKLVDLSQEGSFFKKVSCYKEYLRASGDRSQVASISFTFSADMTNISCCRYAITCSSVRGNLLQNYKMEYGIPGVFLAVSHLVLLRFFRQIVVMTDAMQTNVHFYARKTPVKIPNFIDEPSIETYRKSKVVSDKIKFVFVGSLTRRKQPLLLVQAFQKLVLEGYPVYLDMVGDGPLKHEVRQAISSMQLDFRVTLHGHLANPYPVVASASVFVLPSLSEGLSRASLEALHLGLPCVMRDVDGNTELIEAGKNGYLFIDDGELPRAMTKAFELVKGGYLGGGSLLPVHCRQENAAHQYLLAVESV